MTPAQEQTKKCSKCGEIKGVGEFSKDKSCHSKDGLSYTCRICKTKKQKDWYYKNRAKAINYSRKHYYSDIEHSRNVAKKWRANNLEVAKEASKKWRENNPQKAKDSTDQWRKKQKNNPIFINKPGSWHYRCTKSGAESRKIFFDIDFESFIKSYDGKCALSGRSLHCVEKNIQAPGNQNASPDRIDSSRGYIPGNIQWVDKEINYYKKDHEQKSFIQMCRDVYWTHPGPHSRDLEQEE
jgi:hypothetical protein